MSSSKTLTRMDYILETDKRPFLKSSDVCYYLYEYASGKGYEHSDSNRQIMNFKKPISKKDTNEWKHRNDAIKNFAQILHSQLNGKAFTIIPCPTSKRIDDPNYNDRLIKLCEELGKLSVNYDIQQCIITTKSHEEMHLHKGQRDPAIISQYIEWVEPTRIPNEWVILIDDVYTSGAHFRAYSDLATKHLLKHGCRIAGVFLAKSTYTYLERCLNYKPK